MEAMNKQPGGVGAIGERPPEVPLRKGDVVGAPTTSLLPSPLRRACPEPAEGGTIGGNLALGEQASLKAWRLQVLLEAGR